MELQRVAKDPVMDSHFVDASFVALPKWWVWAHLYEIADIFTGATPPKKDPKNYGDFMPLVKPPQLKDSEISSADDYLSEKGASLARIAPPNSVFVSCIGLLGKTAINRVPVAFNQQINVIVLKEPINSKYIFYYCQTLKNWLYKVASGTTLPIVNKSKFELASIPLAPIPEQRRIVAKIEELFTRLDAGVENIKLVKAQLRRYRESLLNEVINGRLTEQWRREQGAATKPLLAPPEQKNREGDNKISETKERSEAGLSTSQDLPPGWTLASLGDIGKVKGRIGWRGYKKTDLTATGAYVIGATHLTPQGNLDLSNPVFIADEKYDESPEIHVEKGDLMIVQRGATIGRVARLDFDLKKATINPSVILIKDLLGSSQYLLYVLLSRAYQKTLKAGNTSTATPMLTQRFIRRVIVPLPPLDEQMEIVRQISRRFSEVGQIDNIATRSAILALRMKKSILHAAFQGRLVRQEAGEEPAPSLLERIKTATHLSKAKDRTNNERLQQTILENYAE